MRRSVLVVLVGLAAELVLQVAGAFAFARGGDGWWTLAALLGLTGAIGAAMTCSFGARHWWPLFLVLLAGVLILIVGGNVLAAELLRGQPPQTVVVAARSCGHTKSGCVYSYRLRYPDGSAVRGTLTPPGGDDYQVGDRVDVVLDPRGLLGPHEVDALDDGTDAKILIWTSAATVALGGLSLLAGCDRVDRPWPKRKGG
jgi:hypothetical protein